MQHLRIGHYTNKEDQTGVSVFLFEKPVQGVYHLCGSSPASHELHPLELENSVNTVDGLVLTGGSAFGLNCVAGVMQWFKEKNRGVKTPFGNIPIVPAAAIFDLGIGTDRGPTADEAYQACKVAIENNIEQGRIGAGTGATVGKLIPNKNKMSGGLGFAEITLADGLSVIAYVVVNCCGDVRDNEKIIAGACFSSKEFINCEQYILSGKKHETHLSFNTTLAAIFTNAAFSKMELKRIAKIAVAGLARAISPVFTQYDGDIIFCFSMGEKEACELTVGTMAAEAVRLAIINAVKDSVIL
jgi:L-aminopeptidase/D-esterase-like protein